MLIADCCSYGLTFKPLQGLLHMTDMPEHMKG